MRKDLDIYEDFFKKYDDYYLKSYKTSVQNEFKKIIWAFNKVKCDIRVYIAAKKDEEKESTEYIWNYYG